MTCFSYYSTLLGVTIYVHRWYDYRVKCACGDRHLSRNQTSAVKLTAT